MDGKNNIVNGYILAGGKSSRMGTDKGLLVFNGKPIIQQVIEQLRPALNNMVIVSNNPEYEKLGLEVIGDLIKDIGPAGGIHAALSHTHSGKIFIVSCDMPFVTTEAVKYMVQSASYSQITLPLYQKKMEPLFGVYSKECLPHWQQLIELGIIKLQQMITRFNFLTINIDNNELFNDLLFMNINDKSDLNKALKQF